MGWRTILPNKKKSKLQLTAGMSFIYQGKMKYLIAYDYDAPRKNRYTLMILSVSDPVIIGDRITKEFCRELIELYELEFAYQPYWYAPRRDILKCKTKVERRLMAMPIFREEA
jgi:hypothetical protein